MTKTELHRLIDAPYDDEEFTEEDLRAVREAQNEPGMAWSEARRS